MIRTLTNKDMVDAINMVKATYYHDYYHGYGRNELSWIQFFVEIMNGVEKGDPHYLAIGDFDTEGRLQGFMTAKTFRTYYTSELVMDVKDCIIHPENEGKNLFIVKRLFDAMIAHVKEHGGKHWRADSIHTEERAFKYASFLNRFYGAAVHTSSRGVIE